MERNGSQKRLAISGAVALAVALGLLAAPGAVKGESEELAWNPGGLGSAAWRLDPIWDDGNAEFCAYRVRWPRYGRIHQGRALLVAVKEPWNPELDVKADSPHRQGFEVLKLNHIRDVPTGIYTYHQMASVFLRRRSGTVRKVAATSSEACGISTAFLLDGRLATRTYFDGLGDRQRPYPEAALPWDALPLLLREYVRGEIPASVLVFPSLMSGRYGDLSPRRYELRRRGVESFSTPQGEARAVELTLADGADELRLLFAAEPPHRPLRLESSDGTLYELARCDRIPYWEMHFPGDEAWLPDEVR